MRARFVIGAPLRHYPVGNPSEEPEIRVTAPRRRASVARMIMTHALLAAATPARGSLYAIRLRAGRPALADAV
jgi:hypothetical protein